MLMSTTPTLQGHAITHYKGVVGKQGAMLMVSISGTAVVVQSQRSATVPTA